MTSPSRSYSDPPIDTRQYVRAVAAYFNLPPADNVVESIIVAIAQHEVGKVVELDPDSPKPAKGQQPFRQDFMRMGLTEPDWANEIVTMLAAAQRDRTAYFVVGDLIGDAAEVIDARRLKHDTLNPGGGRSRAVFRDRPSRLIVLDADDLPLNRLLPDEDPARFNYGDRDACARLFRAALPQALRQCRLVLAASGNHGQPGKGARLRGFIMADRPLSKGELEALFAGYLVRDGGSFDPSVFGSSHPVYTSSAFLRKGQPAADPYPNLRGFVVEGAESFARIDKAPVGTEKIARLDQKRSSKTGNRGQRGGQAPSSSFLPATFDAALSQIGDGPGRIGLHNGLFKAALRAACDDVNQDQTSVIARLQARMHEVHAELEASGNQARLADWDDRYATIPSIVAGRFTHIRQCQEHDPEMRHETPAGDPADLTDPNPEETSTQLFAEMAFSTSVEEDLRIAIARRSG